MMLLSGLFFLLFSEASGNEALLLDKTRQLTFEGRRAGEGYYSADGSQLVFQSEREPGNPFYQIYLMDLETGDTERVSPGAGKTTCAWIHPDGNRVLYASTHLDPQTQANMKAELDFRASGKSRRYSWDYDEHFDLFVTRRDTGETTRLTSALGYDAEASFSPDGSRIVFASNRAAYAPGLTAEDAERLKIDQSYFIDLYIMDAAGGEPTRLTTSPGYDGGPFFSPDGKRICWRRFSEDGTRAEIHTMNVDGSDVRKLTDLNAMSWAPYFHPSGQYLIFTTNLHGFANFELYLVDPMGQKTVRVTDTDGFDGLPVFSPDGNHLTWTSSRTNGKGAQLFTANWNHAKALALLGETTSNGGVAPVKVATNAGIQVDDLRGHVAALTATGMDGRETGTAGEAAATAYVAEVFRSLGLEPAGDDGTFFQNFPFVSGVTLGKNNHLEVNGKAAELDADWRPLSFSKAGSFEGEVVFVGYGISTPDHDEQDAYDAYVHTDVKDRWVLMYRFWPEDLEGDRADFIKRYAGLRHKAYTAGTKGALGVLVVSGPNAQVNEELVPLNAESAREVGGIPVISISNALAESWLKAAGKDLKALQTQLDQGEMVMGFQLTDLLVKAEVDVSPEHGQGRNVLARLKADDEVATTVALGAHVDHLGRGKGGSLARADEKGQIHHGADDNASGVAAVLEVAESLVDQQRRGKLKLKHDVLFAAWSGEEMGLIGSKYFVDHVAGLEGADSISANIIAYLNMDMVGRLREKLIVQGLGSSDVWAGELERRNAPIGLALVTQQDSYLPTDATAFYTKGVPILSAYTGAHSDYHTPRDTADRLNYEGMRDIARLMGLITRGVATSAEAPVYKKTEPPKNQGSRGGIRVYLGTIPDYAGEGVVGVKLSGVSAGGPAEEAGVKAGDVIVALAGREVANIYDYTYAIEALKVNETTTIEVKRGEERHKLEITPRSRD